MSDKIGLAKLSFAHVHAGGYAEQIKNKQKDEEKVDATVDVTTIVHEAPGPEVIAEEAEKGYDVMIVGLEHTSDREPDFDDSVTTIAMGFKGPLAVTAVRNELMKKPDGKMSILVPVNGTEASRRGAEVAITMARAINFIIFDMVEVSLCFAVPSHFDSILVKPRLATPVEPTSNSRTPKSDQAAPVSSLVAAVHPINGGSAPGMAPTAVFSQVTRLSGV